MPPTEPLFTVLTASKNSSASISQTLESVRTQTFSGVEHIVVDCLSSDGTVEILRRYQDMYALRWVSEPDSGIAEALNKGLTMVRGSYVLVLGSDDYLLGPEILSFVAEKVRKFPQEIVGFAVIKKTADGKARCLVPSPIPYWYKWKMPFLHQGTFVKREVYQMVGGFDTSFRIAFDFDFFYRCIVRGISCRRFSTPIAYMGNKGLSSRPESLQLRLSEDLRVILKNEKNPGWRMVQRILYATYIPIKLRWGARARMP